MRRMRKNADEKRETENACPARPCHGRAQRLHTPGACTRDEAPTAGTAVLGQVRQAGCSQCLAKGSERIRGFLSDRPGKARCTNCRLVLGRQWQFSHNLPFFSSHARLRATTRCLGTAASQFLKAAVQDFSNALPLPSSAQPCWKLVQLCT